MGDMGRSFLLVVFADVERLESYLLSYIILKIKHRVFKQDVRPPLVRCGGAF